MGALFLLLISLLLFSIFFKRFILFLMCLLFLFFGGALITIYGSWFGFLVMFSWIPLLIITEDNWKDYDKVAEKRMEIERQKNPRLVIIEDTIKKIGEVLQKQDV